MIWGCFTLYGVGIYILICKRKYKLWIILKFLKTVYGMSLSSISKRALNLPGWRCAMPGLSYHRSLSGRNPTSLLPIGCTVTRYKWSGFLWPNYIMRNISNIITIVKLKPILTITLTWMWIMNVRCNVHFEQNISTILF